MIHFITSILVISLFPNMSVEILTDDVTLPSPQIIILGATGVGKSTLANVLMGLDPSCKDCMFPICDGAHSCTKQTSYSVGEWIGTGENFTIVDTAGFGDSDNDDNKLITAMVHTLKNVIQTAKCFLLVFKGTDDRFDASIQQMVREMEALFGRNFWKNVLLEFTFWKHDPSSVMQRNYTGKTEEWKTNEINKVLQEKFHLDFDLPAVFIDPMAKQPWNVIDEAQQIIFNQEASKAWEIIDDFPSFEFKTIEDVLEELFQCEDQRDYYKDIVECNITKIQNAVEAMNDKFQIQGDSHEQSINNLDIKVNANKKSVDSLEIQGNSHGLLINNIKIQGDSHELSINNFDVSVNTNLKNIDNLKKQGDLHVQSISNLDIKVETNKKSIDDVENQGNRQELSINNLNTRVEANTKKIDKLESQGDSQELSINTLNIKVDTNIKSINSLKSQGDLHKQSINSLDFSVGTNTKIIDNLKRKGTSHGLSIDSLNVSVGTNTKSIDSLKKKDNSHEVSIKNLNVTIGTNIRSIDQLEKNNLPVGSIISWTGGEKSKTPLPIGWVSCDGNYINKGPMAGSRAPDLNGEGRFLRGGKGSELMTKQEDQVHEHQHTVSIHDVGHKHTDSGHFHQYRDKLRKWEQVCEEEVEKRCARDGWTDTVRDSYISYANIMSARTGISATVHNVMGATTGTETRPKNMVVQWIIKIF